MCRRSSWASNAVAAVLHAANTVPSHAGIVFLHKEWNPVLGIRGENRGLRQNADHRAGRIVESELRTDGRERRMEVRSPEVITESKRARGAWTVVGGVEIPAEYRRDTEGSNLQFPRDAGALEAHRVLVCGGERSSVFLIERQRFEGAVAFGPCRADASGYLENGTGSGWIRESIPGAPGLDTAARRDKTR